jgi:diphthine-ammonia ligase
MTKRFALMWSGGKDSALALDRARRSGLDIARLISFYDSATRRVRFHATRVEMLEAQAAAIGAELHAIATSWPEMEASLGRELASLREEGFAGVVFGDIHLADVRDWYERRVVAAGLEHVEPLWGEAPPALLAEFISSGGRAVLTCVELAKLDESWLGRVIDEQFAADIDKTGIDACGENGEYHSFAFPDKSSRGRLVGWRESAAWTAVSPSWTSSEELSSVPLG